MKFQTQFGPVEVSRGSLTRNDPTNWTTREIRGSEKGSVIGAWIGALAPIVFLGIGMWWMKMPLFFTKTMPNPFVCIVGLIALFGLVKATWETIRLRRFGDPFLELSAAPIPLGGTVEGRIALSPTMNQTKEFKLTLACVRHVVTSSGKNSTTKETILWSTDQEVSLLLGGILPVARFRFPPTSRKPTAPIRSIASSGASPSPRPSTARPSSKNTRCPSARRRPAQPRKASRKLTASSTISR